jgi:hypothetical protein
MKPPMHADERRSTMNANLAKPPTDADERRCQLDRLTKTIIGCVYRVSNTLGCGFLEKVYENALAIELHKAGLKAEQQSTIKVDYDGAVVGDFVADTLVG